MDIDKKVKPLPRKQIEELKVVIEKRWKDKPHYDGEGSLGSPGCVLRAHEVLGLIYTIENLEEALTQANSLSPHSIFQSRVDNWLHECFGEATSNNVEERCDRFIEEALELVQANGSSKERVLALVDYVFGREEGDVNQEIGGVIITLNALASATNKSVANAAECELARVWDKMDVIRQKQANKPKGSALPQ
jgi:hypothetical protein